MKDRYKNLIIFSTLMQILDMQLKGNLRVLLIFSIVTPCFVCPHFLHDGSTFPATLLLNCSFSEL